MDINDPLYSRDWLLIRGQQTKRPFILNNKKKKKKKQWGLKKLSRWYCLFSPSLSRLWSDLVIDTHHMLTVPHPKHRERDTCLESLKGQYEVNIVSLALYLRYYYYWRYIHSVRNSNSFPFHKFILFPPFFFWGGGDEWRIFLFWQSLFVMLHWFCTRFTRTTKQNTAHSREIDENKTDIVCVCV